MGTKRAVAGDESGRQILKLIGAVLAVGTVIKAIQSKKVTDPIGVGLAVLTVVAFIAGRE
jgi:hypothetical protein